MQLEFQGRDMDINKSRSKEDGFAFCQFGYPVISFSAGCLAGGQTLTIFGASQHTNIVIREALESFQLYSEYN